MPLYHFRCPEHGTFEVITSMDDATSVCDCPECGGLSKRAWKVDKAVVVWKGPGGASIHWNSNEKEVEQEMYESIKESDDPEWDSIKRKDWLPGKR